jgi:hypothetical protein
MGHALAAADLVLADPPYGGVEAREVLAGGEPRLRGRLGRLCAPARHQTISSAVANQNVWTTR